MARLPFRIFALFVLWSMLFIVTNCTNNAHKISKKEYQKKIKNWQKERLNSLTKKDSWLTLKGLYLIKQGAQTFGADSLNDMVFPPDTPDQMGTITKKDSTFSIHINAGVEVRADSNKITDTEFKSDQNGQPTIFKHKNYIWYLIKRRDTYYLRLKDTNHQKLKTFEGIRHFPIQRKWHIRATFNPFKNPRPITIPDALGKVYQDSLYGLLSFHINDHEYKLAPLGNPKKDERFFVILGDQTNGNTTYGGGRYLYLPMPDNNNITYIDFNKAYNPPCVFTKYATCPLPPAQNKLDTKITAGEKMYHPK